MVENWNQDFMKTAFSFDSRSLVSIAHSGFKDFFRFTQDAGRELSTVRRNKISAFQFVFKFDELSHIKRVRVKSVLIMKIISCRSSSEDDDFYDAEDDHSIVEEEEEEHDDDVDEEEIVHEKSLVRVEQDFTAQPGKMLERFITKNIL